MNEPLIFEVTFDALVRAFGPRVSEQGYRRLKEAGLDLRARLQPAYPTAVWAKCVHIIGEDVFQGLAPAEAHRRIGRSSVDAYTEGIIGSALFGLLRLIGPSRTIGRMTRNLRTGCNYLETRATQVQPNAFDLWINEVNSLETFYQGLFESGLEHVGAKQLTVVVTSCDSHQCTYRASWAA